MIPLNYSSVSIVGNLVPQLAQKLANEELEFAQNSHILSLTEELKDDDDEEDDEVNELRLDIE